MTKTTTVVAGVGLTMPAWWPSLFETSSWAAQIVPIVSLIWLVLQIGRFVARSARDD